MKGRYVSLPLTSNDEFGDNEENTDCESDSEVEESNNEGGNNEYNDPTIKISSEIAMEKVELPFTRVVCTPLILFYLWKLFFEYSLVIIIRN